jgi:hypothetical protein
MGIIMTNKKSCFLGGGRVLLGGKRAPGCPLARQSTVPCYYSLAETLLTLLIFEPTHSRYTHGESVKCNQLINGAIAEMKTSAFQNFVALSV